MQKNCLNPKHNFTKHYQYLDLDFPSVPVIGRKPGLKVAGETDG